MRKFVMAAMAAMLMCVFTAAQVFVAPMPVPKYQFFDVNGKPLAGGKLCFYGAGSSTPLGTYTDSTGTVLAHNPVILDSSGYASIWLGPYSYKVVAYSAGTDTTCSTGVQQWSVDGISSIGAVFANPPSTGYGSATPAPVNATTVTASTVNASTGAFASVNGVLGIANFGIKCDGVTDDSAGLNLIGSSIPAQGWTVAFPPNSTCVHASSITTWLKPNLRIVGNGARLKFSGTGHGIYLHSTAPETNNNQITGFVLQGNPSADYGVYNDSLTARGKMQFDNIQDFTTGCAYLGLVQLYDQVDISCSGQKATLMGTPQVTRPTNGVILGDDSNPLIVFANNRHVTLQVENTGTGVGVWAKNTGNGNVIYGTSENTLGTGLQLETRASGTTYIGFDLEGNAVQDMLDKGRGNTFIDLLVLGTANFQNATNEHIAAGTANIVDIGGNSAHMYFTGYVNTATLNGNQVSWSFERTNNLSSGVANTGSAWATVFDYVFSGTLAANQVVSSGPVSGTTGTFSGLVTAPTFQAASGAYTIIEAPAGGTDVILCANGGVNCASVHAADGSLSTPSFVNAVTGYKSNGTAGYTGTKTAGACVLTIQGGIITNVTGC